MKAWPPVNEGDGKGLQELSDFLLRCEETMKTMKFMDDLNSTETLKQISAKLPSYTGVKWCRHAFELKKKKEELVQFHDLVLFVKEEAELATEPAFSPYALKEKRRRESRKDERPRLPRKPSVGENSFFTYGKENNQDAEKGEKPRKTCPCCSEVHYLNGCPKFLVKQQEDSKEPKGEEINANSCASVSQSSKNRENVTNCMILPVFLHHKDNSDVEIMVYALLDDASDTIFVAEKALEDLGITGTEVKLNLFTMLGKEEIPTQRVDNLVVRLEFFFTLFII